MYQSFRTLSWLHPLSCHDSHGSHTFEGVILRIIWWRRSRACLFRWNYLIPKIKSRQVIIISIITRAYIWFCDFNARSRDASVMRTLMSAFKSGFFSCLVFLPLLFFSPAFFRFPLICSLAMSQGIRRRNKRHVMMKKSTSIKRKRFSFSWGSKK